MNVHDVDDLAWAAEPFDSVDAELIRLVRAVAEVFDPLPAGLVQRLQIAVTLDALDADSDADIGSALARRSAWSC